jgi:nitronate monooxygenase
VLLGSRLLMSEEALVPAGVQDAVIRSDGDATVKTSVIDVVRGLNWPREITGRALRNRFVEDWQGREAALAEPATTARELRRFTHARESGDTENTGIFIGEVAGLLKDVQPAEMIVKRMVADAEALIAGRQSP